MLCKPRILVLQPAVTRDGEFLALILLYCTEGVCMRGSSPSLYIAHV